MFTGADEPQRRRDDYQDGRCPLLSAQGQTFV